MQYELQVGVIEFSDSEFDVEYQLITGGALHYLIFEDKGKFYVLESNNAILTRDLHSFNSLEEMDTFLEGKNINRKDGFISLVEILESEISKQDILEEDSPKEQYVPLNQRYKSTFEEEEEKKLQKRKKTYLTKRRKTHPDRSEEELEADWELYYLGIQEEQLKKEEKKSAGIGKKYFIGSRASRDPKQSKARLIKFAQSLLPSDYSGDFEWIEYDKKLTWEENWKEVIRKIEGKGFSVEYNDSAIRNIENMLGKKIESYTYLINQTSDGLELNIQIIDREYGDNGMLKVELHKHLTDNRYSVKAFVRENEFSGDYMLVSEDYFRPNERKLAEDRMREIQSEF